MQVQSPLFTLPTTSELSTPMFVREYTSTRAFRHDARDLYARTGYTVSNTSGLTHYGYFKRIFALLARRPEHLVITYQAPTNV
jgi:hypothetical protein